jgi:anti-sigma factor RsiW
MKVTKDVVVDLLPLYVSGEASSDTRKLVEDYLRSDPALAQEVAELSRSPALASEPPLLVPDLQLRTLMRTRRALKLRGALLGSGIFFTLLPCSFVAGDGHLRWAWTTNPAGSAVSAALAALAWAAYAVTRRSLRATGL